MGRVGTGKQPPAPAPASYPGVTGREQAIVLIGLIIIAVVLKALGVSGIECRHTDNIPVLSARAHGTAPCAWSTVPSMASSSPVWRGDGI